MFFRLFGWFFKTFTPYILGVLIGVGFFFLLLRFTAGPVGMSWEGDEKTSNDAVKVVKQAPIPTEEMVVPSSLIVKDSAMMDKINSVAQSQAKFRADYLANRELKKSTAQKASKIVAKPNLSIGEPDNIKIEAKTEKVTTVASSNIASKIDITPKHCGPQPLYQGVERNRFIACQWRNSCLASRLKSNAMFAQGRKNCVMSGRNPVACRDYFDSMEKRNSLESCNRLRSNQNTRSW
jgi:hypothetical protein